MSYFNGKNNVYLIAEIGGNHEGDFEYAKKLTKLAAESGADAVKFQIYTGDSLVNAKYDPDRNEHFKKFELTKQQYIDLAKLCDELEITFMASVWDMNALNYIDSYIPIYKVGSGDLTAYNLIKKIVLTGKPIILSTGLATFDEVKATVSFIESIDQSYIVNKKLALLQCTSMYPIPDSDVNLNVISTYMDEFDIPIGYSDHSIGMDAIETAVAMGAEIIEVHFTDERKGKKFRDHMISATKDEIASLINKIKKIKILQGSFDKKPVKSEIDSGHVKSFRRGIYAKKELQVGDIINEDSLITLRPLVGCGAEDFYNLIGTRVLTDKVALEKLDK